MPVDSQDVGQGNTNTRNRLLQAAESLFIEHGYEAMLVQEVTRRAEANSAAVNYHFGGKELLMREVLARRLNRLNIERLELLSCCEEHSGGKLDAAAILSILFVPALRLSRPPNGHPSFISLLGRVYSDTSPFIRNYLEEHYRPIFERFFEAFSRALPQMSRSELSMRLRFSLQGLAGLLAGQRVDELIFALGMGQQMSEDVLLARLIALVLPMLTDPLGTPDQVSAVRHVAGFAEAAATAADAAMQTSAASVRGRG
ncbi:TetR/AcrR family transcriptional regulator [Dyella sp.]|uniref:TetR/AcrR family transcriptional regulator n=1 Tax=Dyella sp. TaxID=1869338 RepID=UPI002ED2701A